MKKCMCWCLSIIELKIARWNTEKGKYILFFPKFRLQKLLYLATSYTGCIGNAWTHVKGEFFILEQRNKSISIYVWKRVFNGCFWKIWWVFDRESLMICRQKIQLDATQWFIELIIRSTCFGQCYAHHQ